MPDQSHVKDGDLSMFLQIAVNASAAALSYTDEIAMVPPWMMPTRFYQMKRRQPSSSAGPEVTGMKLWDIILTSVLALVMVIFCYASIRDFYGFWKIARSKDSKEDATDSGQGSPESQKTDQDDTKDSGAAEPPAQPMYIIFGLTVYRFYTGFLSATWLPYLLAMEGAELWEQNQALFMGFAKLIYGLSILLTPLFGLIGDKLALISHAMGRRLFVRVGIIVASCGIFLCHVSAQTAPKEPGHFSIFMVGIWIWRLGEGLNDVTSEAICPEMLPKNQFEISSIIKGSMFLVGGLAGYVMVIIFVHIPYYWLYQAYIIMMVVCGIPPLLAIRDVPQKQTRGATMSGEGFLRQVFTAYMKPSQFEGGFPRACLCIFLFSSGSAPMFFLLLMLRDLVGITDQVSLQRNFSLISIDFFLAAAIAAALNGVLLPGSQKVKRGERPSNEVRRGSFVVTALATVGFGIVCMLMPFVYFFESQLLRARAFYVLSGLLGATFGLVFSRFQDCTWQLLPPNVEFANAMGFSTMWKLLGAGFGNFIAGLILDLCHKPPEANASTSDTKLVGYKFIGYLIVCASSTLLSWVAAALVFTIPGKVERALALQSAGS